MKNSDFLALLLNTFKMQDNKYKKLVSVKMRETK